MTRLQSNSHVLISLKYSIFDIERSEDNREHVRDRSRERYSTQDICSTTNIYTDI